MCLVWEVWGNKLNGSMLNMRHPSDINNLASLSCIARSQLMYTTLAGQYLFNRSKNSTEQPLRGGLTTTTVVSRGKSHTSKPPLFF